MKTRGAESVVRLVKVFYTPQTRKLLCAGSTHLVGRKCGVKKKKGMGKDQSQSAVTGRSKLVGTAGSSEVTLWCADKLFHSLHRKILEGEVPNRHLEKVFLSCMIVMGDSVK